MLGNSELARAATLTAATKRFRRNEFQQTGQTVMAAATGLEAEGTPSQHPLAPDSRWGTGARNGPKRTSRGSGSCAEATSQRSGGLLTHRIASVAMPQRGNESVILDQFGERNKIHASVPHACLDRPKLCQIAIDAPYREPSQCLASFNCAIHTNYLGSDLEVVLNICTQSSQ